MKVSRSERAERLVRIAARLLSSPSKSLSLTETAASFGVSKTLISDDVDLINSAVSLERIGRVVTDRGRTGGSYYLPAPDGELCAERLGELCRILSVPERLLPGDLVYYTDLIFDPHWGSFLGSLIASMFEADRPTVIMTTEVKGIPIALFVSYVLGLPLAVCRFRNRPSDGPAVAVHYPTVIGDVRTMYLSTKLIDSSSRVLIVDDFMRGGSTISGMRITAGEFKAKVVGVGTFITAKEPVKKTVEGHKTLLRLTVSGGVPQLTVSDDVLK